ncbi:MAG TPA: hypothetical protein VLM18_12180 [Croceibacterium sp.]|nr:hypothetical protein [Croceibacterium sp.]
MSDDGRKLGLALLHFLRALQLEQVELGLVARPWSGMTLSMI